MKKVIGASFGVRFYRRSVTKSAAKDVAVPEKGEMRMNDIPEQTALPQAMAEDSKTPVYSPAKLAREKMLREAAEKGDCYLIRVLVMEGVDLDARDGQGRTALNIATQYSRQDAIKTLLAAREMRRMAKLGDLPDTAFFRKFQQKKTTNS